MAREYTINSFEYRVYYCRPEQASNNWDWHVAYCNTLEHVKSIIDWCIGKGLIIKEIKALIKR